METQSGDSEAGKKTYKNKVIDKELLKNNLV